MPMGSGNFFFFYINVNVYWRLYGMFFVLMNTHVWFGKSCFIMK